MGPSQHPTPDASRRIDLHAHSTASDGTDSPAELMAAADAAGLAVLALTDHDTTGGWAAAEAARPDHLALLRGAEFSTRARGEGRYASIHLLGYLFDPADPAIAAEQARLRTERLHRGVGIVQKMVADGLPISVDQVLGIAANAPVGRPHIGRALVAAGVVDSVDEAFGTLLSARGPYYVPKVDTELIDAISMIAAAGGVSVLAHSRARGEARVLTEARIGDSPRPASPGSRSTTPTMTRRRGPNWPASPPGSGWCAPAPPIITGTTRRCGSGRSRPPRASWTPWSPPAAAGCHRWGRGDRA